MESPRAWAAGTSALRAGGGSRLVLLHGFCLAAHATRLRRGVFACLAGRATGWADVDALVSGLTEPVFEAVMQDAALATEDGGERA